MPGAAADVESTARGFDRLAPFYDALAVLGFGDRIHASQIALLERLPPIRRALVMGGGTGRFLAALLAHDPAARAVSIDVSAGMTRRTAERLALQGSSDRAEFRIGGLDKLVPGERFDLVVTHCFLDLFEEPLLSEIISALKGAVEPAGLWLFSDFETSGTGLPRFARASAVAGLYAFFRATCGIAANRLPDFDGAFARAGLKSIETRSFALGLLRARILRKT